VRFRRVHGLHVPDNRRPKARLPGRPVFSRDDITVGRARINDGRERKCTAKEHGLH
jgi:hypothetical protein